MSDKNSIDPKDLKSQDPKIILAHYLNELKNLKKTLDSHAITDVAIFLRDYSPNLDLQYGKSNLFFNDCQYLAKISHDCSVNELLHKDSPRILEVGKEHLEKGIDNVVYHLDSLVRSPMELRLKTIPVKNKKGVFDIFRKKNNMTNSKNDKESNLSKPRDFESLDIESSKNRYKYKIQVFISHIFSEEDVKLAKTLKKLLEERGIYGYIAEVRPEFELPLDEKIQKEITDAHYVVGIITHDSKTSPSVNQELGYALGKDISLILMVEKNVKHGVLTTPREIQEFTRDNFPQVCKRVIDYILERDIPKKISGPEKKWLIDAVYRPCYNSMINAYKTNFIEGVPDDPWEHLEAYAKLRTESDMKEFFENYTKDLNLWRVMWTDFQNNFQNNRDKAAVIIMPAFVKYGLLDERGHLDNLEGSTWDLVNWIHNCSDVLFDNRIKNEEELYQLLRSDTMRRWGRFYGMLDKWKKEKPEIYTEILKLIPELVRALGAKYSYQEIDKQRQILKESIKKLTLALEEKLK